MRRVLVIVVLVTVFAFVSCNKDETIVEPILTAYSNKVYEFKPAPGQFINKGYQALTMEQACKYAQQQLSKKNILSLGGFGGYVVVGFDHKVMNVAGEYDFAIMANAATTGSSEPGIVWVMPDENGDGLPNDTWYELIGSEHGKEGVLKEYQVTYFKPDAPKQDVAWQDNMGASGVIDYLSVYHDQDYYYPTWISEQSYTLSGTCLTSLNVQHPVSGDWANGDYEWGYADNFGEDQRSDGENFFKLENAVDAAGAPIVLTHIDFIKVQTGVNAKSGWIGELSTEVLSFRDINF